VGRVVYGVSVYCKQGERSGVVFNAGDCYSEGLYRLDKVCIGGLSYNVGVTHKDISSVLRCSRCRGKRHKLVIV
jgi:hypothetical protein